MRIAIGRRLFVIDRRLICNSAAGHANPIEPSSVGGAKIAAAVLRAVEGNVPVGRAAQIVGGAGPGGFGRVARPVGRRRRRSAAVGNVDHPQASLRRRAFRPTMSAGRSAAACGAPVGQRPACKQPFASSRSASGPAAAVTLVAATAAQSRQGILATGGGR